MMQTQVTQTLEFSRTVSQQPGNEYDVAIVGGGIIGLTLAAALKDSGLEVLIIEAKAESKAIAFGQAYAVQMLSAQIYQGIGVWDKILPRIEKFRHVRMSDGDHPNIVKFEPGDLGTEDLGYVAEHQALLAPLHEFLQDCSNITYLCPASVIGTEYKSDFVAIEIEIGGELRTIRSKLLVAADGARSRTRDSAGIKTRGWKYWQSCIVAFVKPEKPHNNTAYEKFWASGPFAILPLPGDRCRIVWTAPHEEAKALCALDDEQFLTELTKRYGNQMGKLQLLGDRFIFPVQLMQSDRYVLHRLALVGDAAHNCHPVGGQGLNLGIKDAAALAQIIKEAKENGKDIGDIKILKQYQKWRQLENLTILGFTDVLDRVFSNDFAPLVFLRRLTFWVMPRIPFVKVLTLKLMVGLLGRKPQIVQR
jgi:2-octaprenyl-6-methoxyphenol hydroxylase